MAWRSRRAPERDWGSLRPCRACAWEARGEVVHLLVPRFGRGRLARWLEGLLRASPYRVHLDELGSFVWRRCDGSTTVRDIGEALRAEFGERVEPVGPRLATFIARLERGRFVVLEGR